MFNISINNKIVLSVANVKQKVYKDGVATGEEKTINAVFFQEIDDNGTPITTKIKLNDDNINIEELKTKIMGKSVNINNIVQHHIVQGKKVETYSSCNSKDITPANK